MDRQDKLMAFVQSESCREQLGGASFRRYIPPPWMREWSASTAQEHRPKKLVSTLASNWAEPEADAAMVAHCAGLQVWEGASEALQQADG